MVDFYTLLKEIREESLTEREKGTRFEKLIRDYLRTSARYSTQLAEVWLWEDFPGRKELGGKDLGIDLVAKTKSGDYWAIQCKCYAEGTVISKEAVDSFLANSSRTFTDVMEGTSKEFSNRIWIATSSDWGKNAREMLQNQKTPVTCIYANDIAEDTTVDWDALNRGLHGKTAEKRESHKLRPHQETALEKAHEYYQNHDRGKMIMACGTGKTFTSLKLVEKETNQKGMVLVLVPSIALINQTLNEWDANSENGIYPICVCSDSTASRKRKADGENEDHIDLALPASTDYRSVARQLEAAKKEAEHLIVVYSTYQSIEVISKAQKYLMGEWKEEIGGLFKETAVKKGDFTFDFIVCDEAHRTTGIKQKGQDESAFTRVHDDAFIHAKKRLYMTATPRLYAETAKKKAEEKDVILCSMDDPALYGEEFYRIGFGEAVEKGLLSDYKVLILTVPDNTPIPVDLQAAIRDKQEEINADDAIKIIGCVNALSKRVMPDPDTNQEIVKAIDPGLMHRAVAFCQNINMSKLFSQSFETYGEKIRENFAKEFVDDTVVTHAKHIDGTMDAGKRNDLVAWLKKAPQSGTECRILTNVRCLSEGVDVPSLDAILFLSARNSEVDVVQSVGRVMRKAPEKRYGYIVIPVVVPADEDPNEYLDDNNRYSVIWKVLNALRAHDDRFNALVNQIELNEKKPKNIIVGPGSGYKLTDGDPGKPQTINPEIFTQQLLFSDQLSQAVYARMVTKVGNKRYWTQWAGDVARIAAEHTKRIRNMLSENEDYRTAFDMFMEGLHKNINPNIGEDTAIDMLAQHMVTRPVFEALFENYSFAEHNPISRAMKELMDLIGETGYEKDQRTLDRFYKSVKDRCAGIDNAQGKQKVIIELYDTFFKVALKNTVEKLGIVYTPVEVVDFINQSVADVLKKEFNRSLSDENIHIIDPFTGTGTFITRMIQSGLIDKKDLPRKYEKELHANELILLAYYIASINIENAYHDSVKEQEGNYTPFPGICLTDTFQLYEDRDNETERLKFSEVFKENSERINRQNQVPMRIIIGNPPYSIGQRNANDNSQNEHYEKLEQRIADTYVAGTKATNKNALYDSYIKAFRYASDLLDEENGGVIGFVTNGGWLEGNAMNGLRKCFETEFSSIYIYHLRGNTRTSGEVARKEGGQIFGSGSRAPIVITILVKNPKAKKEKADIYYREMDDYMKREQKLAAVSDMKSVLGKGFTQKVLHPNDAGDWLNQRSDVFGDFIAMGDKEDKGNEKTFFVSYYSNGLKTQRDAWCYSFSEKKLAKRIKDCIAYYNDQVKRFADGKINEVEFDSRKFSWTRAPLKDVTRGRLYSYNEGRLNIAIYRPFCKEKLYFSKQLNEMLYQMPKLFPTPEHSNLVICISGLGGTKDNTAIISDTIVDLNCLDAGTQCFPLYWYEKQDAMMGTLFDGVSEDRWVRHSGITDYILQKARTQYEKENITEKDIFYYVYGFLHSEAYRKEFAADLKKMLPRIPLVDELKDFVSFSQAGRDLAALHLAYENQKPPACVTVTEKKKDYRVTKMRFPDKNDKSTISYNAYITISGIPQEAYEYVVNGKSAIEWIMERYQVKTDKDSGITNDPNDWAAEHKKPRYILDLLLSVITVSTESMKIIRSLPDVKFGTKV